MANTLSIMNAIRNVVSKQRIRYTENGFDLDLAYICDNIIAMGYPAENIEAMYRNHIEHVYQFFDIRHKDHYKIYNLCSERSYDVNKFHGRVAVYPFDDHNPPTIELIRNFCDDIDRWLKEDKKNVAAVHCKAGKGRTGTMICCYLLHSGFKTTAEDALAFYDEKRTKDRKGVTIPSQRRYVDYYSRLIRSSLPYEKRTVQICEIRFSSPPSFHAQGSVHCVISTLSSLPDHSNSDKFQALQAYNIDFRKTHNIEIDDPISITGDVKIEVFHKIMRKKEKCFHFWFNTYFVCDDAVCVGNGSDAKYVYELTKHELDDAHKDKEHKNFPEDFNVQVVFKNLPQRIFIQSNENSHSNHQLGLNSQQKQNQISDGVTLGVLPTGNCTGNNIMEQFMHQNRKNHQPHLRFNSRPHHHYQQQQQQQQQQQPQLPSPPHQLQQHQQQFQLQPHQQQQQSQQQSLQKTTDLLQNPNPNQNQNQQLCQRNCNFNHNLNEFVDNFQQNGDDVPIKKGQQSQKKELSFHPNSNEANIRETPSVSPDVSRSNSTSGSSSNSSNSGDASTIGEDWESGEFVIQNKSNMIMDDEKTNYQIISNNNLTSKRSSSRFKVRRKKSNLNILKSSFRNKTTVNTTSNNYSSSHNTSSTKLKSKSIKNKTKSTLQSFKISKLNNVKMHSSAQQHNIVVNNSSSKKRSRYGVFRKMRWLSNIKSDPDLCDALAKSVHFRSHQDVGKKSSEIHISDVNSECSNIDYYSSLCDKQLSFDVSPSKSSFLATSRKQPNNEPPPSFIIHKTYSIREKHEQDAKDIAMNKLVVAKPIESHSIGFNVSNDDNSTGQNLNNISSENPLHISKDHHHHIGMINKNGNDFSLNPVSNSLPRANNDSTFHDYNLNKDKPIICDTAQSLMMLSITSSSPPARMSNRCVPFSFKDIRQELQSVIKQNTNRPKTAASNDNRTSHDNNGSAKVNNTRFSLVGGNKNKNSLPSTSSSPSSSTSPCKIDKRKDT